MWALPKITNDIATILLEPQSITCAHIERISWFAKKSQHKLRAYRRKPLHNYDLCDGIVFNFQNIVNIIHSFLRENRLTNACIALAIDNQKETISQEQLLQYKLLAIMGKLNTIHLTTTTHAHSRGQDEIKNNSINTCLKPLRNVSLDYANEHDHLIKSFGLYLLGKQTYEAD